ncbi:MAG: tetratricopeptide repeat protein [Salinivirgaceae bacterium]
MTNRSGVVVVLILLFSNFTNAQVDTALLKVRALVTENNFPKAYGLLSQMPDTRSVPEEVLLQTTFYTHHYSQMRDASKSLKHSNRFLQYYFLAAYYVRQNNTDSAFLMLEQLVEQRNKPPRGKLRTDSLFAPLKTDSRWDSLWSGDHYLEFDNKVEQAARELNIKNYRLALSLLDELIDQKPFKDEVWYLRSCALYEQGFTRSALDDISEAIKRRKRSWLYFAHRAKVLMKLDKHKKALKEVQKAIELDPTNPVLYRIATLAAGKAEKPGIDFSTLYLAAYPDSASALYHHASMVSQSGSCMQALPFINQAIARESNNPNFRFLRAQIYQQCKVYTQAVADYGFCMDFWPRKPELYLNRGICRYELNQRQAGCKDLRRALDLGALEADQLIHQWCR